MVNLSGFLQYLAIQTPLNSVSTDQLNATRMAVTTYELPALPYAYDVSRAHMPVPSPSPTATPGPQK